MKDPKQSDGGKNCFGILAFYDYTLSDVFVSLGFANSNDFRYSRESLEPGRFREHWRSLFSKTLESNSSTDSKGES